MSRKSEQCEQCADEPVGGSRSLDLPLLTVVDVAELLNVPKSTVYRLVRRRELETIRLGRHFRFQRSALCACINNRRCLNDQKR